MASSPVPFLPSKGRTSERENYITRFSLRQRLEHWAVMGCFVILVVTGLPQKFSEAGWAQWLIWALGGIDLARLIHRYLGILLAGVVVIHLSCLVYLLAAGRARPTMLPSLRDASDAIAMLKYDLGLSDQEPQFDRYDYRQKFEYWGLLFGVFIMIVTGFILYFPTWLTRIFPGEVVAATKVAHSQEALLALLVVVTWHLYGAHFNPDAFPFDSSIFTGKISLERMLKEHPLEYARLVEQGKLKGLEPEEEKADKEPERPPVSIDRDA